ncbi:carboxypeptidase-like regulatory domain-containing protein [Mucilaginibacter antarcticus]|uniref:Carboxypeptidase-like regulatory domain-containing protein n=1 Tax=Mucilaginibacter antarcticus TaxID=1855725 RepID=A0ABW5XR13_9SPHI
MNPFCRILLFALFFSNATAWASAPYFIAGKVVDEKGAVVAGATVFISGSQKVTVTNDEGRFIFNSIDAGTYHLSVQMLGYNSLTQNVMVQTESVNLNLTLKVKPIVLNTVNIGGDGNWAKNYELFKRHFLGITPNAQHCKILNPEVISFGTQGKKLTAEADELLIIENKLLGYRIRYLLKSFNCTPAMHTASYDGDPIFEPLQGTDADSTNWAANRLNTYKGSLMHFLRAVYTNSVLQEGFIANQLYVLKNSFGNFHADPRPVKFDTIVNVLDTSFVAAKFNSLYINYDPKKAAELATMSADSVKKRLIMSPTGSVLNLYLKEAVIDRRGNYVDYRTFLLQGLWGRRGLADQLPFEYQPNIATK